MIIIVIITTNKLTVEKLLSLPVDVLKYFVVKDCLWQMEHNNNEYNTFQDTETFCCNIDNEHKRVL